MEVLDFEQLEQASFDYIVIGGGSAGVVMATRLSEQADRTVLLLEAGADHGHAVPAALLDSNVPVTSGHNWDLQAMRRQEGLGAKLAHLGRAAKVFEVASSRLALARTAPAMLMGGGDSLNKMSYPMGKVMGGSSSVNGALALHARESDFAAWEQGGNDFWRWSLVQPWIARFDGAAGEGPVWPLSTPEPAHYTRLQKAFHDSCGALGFAPAGAAGAAGVHPLAKNTRDRQRASSAMIYLDAARGRKNLTIVPHCLVDKLILSRRGGGLRADGVEAHVGGATRRFLARHVVLSAGAIHSPGVLLRSGIGAAAELRPLGIEPVLELPAVGHNLQDHPVVSLWAVPQADAFTQGEAIHQLMLEHGANGSEHCDLQLLMLSAVPTALFPPLDDFVGAPVASGISVMLSKPVSTGSVALVSRDPARAPRIYLNCLEADSDLRRMMQGVRLAWRILQSEPLRSLHSRSVLWNDTIIASDNLLANAIRTTVRAAWHPVGTLRMGADGDAKAVVDQYGSLRGVSNVTVADASIMPTIPGVPTNLSCMLIGERLAAVLVSRDAVHRRVA